MILNYFKITFCSALYQVSGIPGLRACMYIYIYIFFLWRCDPTWAMASSLLRFLDHTQRRTTFGRTPLDERSSSRRDFYLTTHNTHNRQTYMPPVGFEPTISAVELPQTYALDRSATRIGIYIYIYMCVCVYIYIYILHILHININSETIFILSRQRLHPIKQREIVLGLNYCGGKIMTVPAADIDMVRKL